MSDPDHLPFKVPAGRPWTDLELDEVCLHCAEPRRSHEMRRFKFADDSLLCRTGEHFEATGRYADVPPGLAALRELRAATLRGFSPTWESVRRGDGTRTGDFKLHNDRTMRRTAEKGRP